MGKSSWQGIERERGHPPLLCDWSQVEHHLLPLLRNHNMKPQVTSKTLNPNPKILSLDPHAVHLNSKIRMMHTGPRILNPIHPSFKP